MLRFALKMLMGDRLKYLGIVMALSFASFIISQQGGIFLGIINRTFGFITDTSQAAIWVVDPSVQYIDDIKPMKDTALYRVLSVQGVEWAVPLFKGLIECRLPSGIFQSCVLIGIDNATLIGGPPVMVQGKIENLRKDDAIIVDENGAQTKLATIYENKAKERFLVPLQIGDTIELNDHRGYVVGTCSVSRTFESQPVIYTTYDRAVNFVPQKRRLLSFIIAHPKPGCNIDEVCKAIRAQTGLAAYSRAGMKRLTVEYYMKNTGIFINFGVAIGLGFIIGIAIAGQTFYNFTLDNVRYFGTFKAMGADNPLLRRMILMQALFLSLIGWGIGIAATSIFGFSMRHTELSFSFPWYLFAVSGVSLLCICLIAAFFSIRHVEKTDPAIVFK